MTGGENVGNIVKPAFEKPKQEIITIKKRTVTDEEIAEALEASYGVQTAACQWLAKNKKVQIERSTISKRIAKSEMLQKAAHTATDVMLDVAENKLFNLINKGDKTAIIFFLKCKGKGRGYVERQEISADVKAEVKKANPFEGMTIDEIKALAHAQETSD